MSHRLPFLTVLGPDGQAEKIILNKDRVTIGRFAEFNDVALEPDPQQLVSQVHCAVEQDSGVWWIVDNPKEPAFLQIVSGLGYRLETRPLKNQTDL